MFAMPPVTQALLIINVLAYLLQNLVGGRLILAFGLWPIDASNAQIFDAPTFQVWQLLTYGFLHGGLTHLFFNMLAVFMFGAEVERVWGTKRYLTYYLVCVVSAGIAQLLVASSSGGVPYPTVGASGGVFGLLLAFGMMFPRRMVMLLLPPIPMPAWLLVTLYGALELFLGVTGTQPGVAHFAHLGGMAGGFLLIQYWRGRLPFKPPRR